MNMFGFDNFYIKKMSNDLIFCRTFISDVMVFFLFFNFITKLDVNKIQVFWNASKSNRLYTDQLISGKTSELQKSFSNCSTKQQKRCILCHTP